MEIFAEIWHQLLHLIGIILHLDLYLVEWTNQFGVGIYVILFAVIFAETGFVVTPFLPGDSLLFAAGAVAALEGSQLNTEALIVLLSMAAVLGNMVNYFIGRKVGPGIFNGESSVWFNKKHLVRTREFYKKYGSFAVVVSRFAPILRTFAPFVAGIGQMDQQKFLIYNALGGTAWVSCFVGAGYFFGNLPAVKEHFHWVILGIIVISALPAVLGWLKSRQGTLKAG